MSEDSGLPIASSYGHLLDGRELFHVDEFFFEFGLHFIPHIYESELDDFEFLFALHDKGFALRLMLALQVSQFSLVALNHFV